MGNVLDFNQLAVLATQISGQLVDSQLAGIAGSKITGTVAAANIDTAIARLASPAFTGTPTGPTAALNDTSAQLATCAFVNRGTTFGSSSGGMKFANGIILNWGLIGVGDHAGGGFGGGTGTGTFQYAYPSACLGLVASIVDSNDTASIILNTSNWSTSGFNWATSEMAAITQDYSISYFSVGY